MIKESVLRIRKRERVLRVRSQIRIMMAVVVILIGLVLVSHAIAIRGSWGNLAFIVVGSAAMIFVPAHWLAIIAISLYQGFPIDLLDISLTPESQINFRLSDLILALLLIRTLARWLLQSRTVKRRSADFGLLGLLTGFLLWSFLTSLLLAGGGSTPLLDHLTSLGKMMLPLSLAFYLALMVIRSREFESVLGCVIGWGLVQCLAGFILWLPVAIAGVDWISFEEAGRDWLAIPSHSLLGGIPTLTGLFGDPAKLGYWLVVALWAKVYFIRSKEAATIWDRGLLLILILGAVATTRRGPLSTLVASATVYLLVTRGRILYLSQRVFRRGALMILVTAITLLAGFVVPSIQPVSDIFRITRDINFGFWGRLDQSRVLWKNFLEAPFSGMGWMGNSLAGKTFWAAPNYMVILADLGVFGLALFLCIIVVSLFKTWSCMKRSRVGTETHEISQFAFVSLVGLYAAMVSDIILIGGQPTLFLFGICLGIVARPGIYATFSKRGQRSLLYSSGSETRSITV